MALHGRERVAPKARHFISSLGESESRFQRLRLSLFHTSWGVAPGCEWQCAVGATQFGGCPGMSLAPKARISFRAWGNAPGFVKPKS